MGEMGEPDDRRPLQQAPAPPLHYRKDGYQQKVQK
jgi:hypothetical protein